MNREIVSVVLLAGIGGARAGGALEPSAGGWKGRPIEPISDHGISLGIYTRAPDGNGVEVFYESPRAEWPVDYHIFSRDNVRRGRFPGPWDAEIRADGPPVTQPQTAAAE
jgi:hypothetical protein